MNSGERNRLTITGRSTFDTVNLLCVMSSECLSSGIDTGIYSAENYPVAVIAFASLRAPMNPVVEGVGILAVLT